MSLQENLLKLFLLEQKVRGLQSRSESAANRLRIQSTRLKQSLQQQTELGEQLRLAQAKAAGLEGQMKDLELRVDKLRGQMNNVTNNKEYAALLLEVNTLKGEKSKFEDQTLEAMGKVDALKAEYSGLETKVAEQNKLVAVAQNELTSAKEAVAGELNPLIIERDKAREEVPIDARNKFDQMLDIHDGEAMASVIEESRKHLEYSCGGCYLSIPVERLNALMVRDEVVCCPSCGRILFVEKELRASFSPD